MPPTPRRQDGDAEPNSPQAAVATAPSGVIAERMAATDATVPDQDLPHRRDARPVEGSGATADPDTGVLPGVELQRVGGDELAPAAGPHYVQTRPEERGGR